MPTSIDWTPAMINQLVDLWTEGLTTADIGRRLKTTKNAVVGKVHRLGLPPRRSPIRRSGRNATPATVHRHVPSQTLAKPKGPARERPPAAPLRRRPPEAVAAGTNACCWPTGEPGTASFRFCGSAAVPGRVYCDQHAAIAYRPKPRAALQAAGG